MKICLGQINTTPGDFAGNLAAIKRGIDLANTADGDAIVFPELSIPGYLSQDLMYHPQFIERNLQGLQELIAYSHNCSDRLHIVVGYIDRNPKVGKPFFNMAGVICHGALAGRYKKQLLPFYDVFDEQRYFEPGHDLLVLEIADHKVGVTICEDLWNDKSSDDYNYEQNPMQQYRRLGVDTIFSLNSSPFVHGKPEQRLKTIGASTEAAMAVVYVNQRGGQDELVFDGHSFVMSHGHLVHLVRELAEDSFDLVELPIPGDIKTKPTAPPLIKPDPLFDLLVLALKDYVYKSGFQDLVLASSGGVDSALVCKLACEAVGAEHVHAIRMPSIYSSAHACHDAIQLHQNLGCWDYKVEINHLTVIDQLNNRYLAYPSDSTNLVTRKMQTGYAEIANENIQARLRDLYVMHFSNAFGAMPLATGNKTESACGYYTHFDMNFSYAPIKDLYKFQVINLARACADIPANIWQKPPSAELAEEQTDAASLLPYAVLDPMVQAYVESYISTFEQYQVWLHGQLVAGAEITLDPSVLTTWLEGETAHIDFGRIIRLIGRMEYKRRQTCPGTKVSPVAFGMGRRIPIVKKWS